MTIDEQAQALEHAYATFARQQTRQPWLTEEDRREALNTLKGHLREAERTLRLPETGDTTSGRARLVLWTEMARATIEEREASRR